LPRLLFGALQTPHLLVVALEVVRQRPFAHRLKVALVLEPLHALQVEALLARERPIEAQHGERLFFAEVQRFCAKFQRLGQAAKMPFSSLYAALTYFY